MKKMKIKQSACNKRLQSDLRPMAVEPGVIRMAIGLQFNQIKSVDPYIGIFNAKKCRYVNPRLGFKVYGDL